MSTKEIDDNPVKIFTYKCGCKIIGTPPYVSKVTFCPAHKTQENQLRDIAPISAGKILKWEEEKSYAKPK